MLKAIIVILLIAILISLFSGLVFLVKDPSDSKRTVHSLAIRVALAILLIGIIFIASQTGHLSFNPSPINAF